MTTQQRLKRLLHTTGKTQTELAQMLAVSFATLNSWVNDKSTPRSNARERIDILYQEYTGASSIEDSVLQEKKKKIAEYKKQFRHPLQHILQRKDLYDTLVLALTYHTNSIEGSTFTEPEVRAVLFDNVTIPNKSIVEHQEAKNHQAALGNMMRWLKEQKTQPVITEEKVRKLHAILMNGIRMDAGYYRHHGVRIVGSHIPTANYLQVPNLMKKWIKTFQAAAGDEFYSHLAKTHAQFEKIHPFSDGNGRVGRLIMHAVSLQQGFPPVLIPQEKKQAYYAYLQRAQLQDEFIFLESMICDALLGSYALLRDI